MKKLLMLPFQNGIMLFRAGLPQKILGELDNPHFKIRGAVAQGAFLAREAPEGGQGRKLNDFIVDDIGGMARLDDQQSKNVVAEPFIWLGQRILWVHMPDQPASFRKDRKTDVFGGNIAPGVYRIIDHSGQNIVLAHPFGRTYYEK
jgi:hypothetical protein